jgi:hypothetical protein
MIDGVSRLVKMYRVQRESIGDRVCRGPNRECNIMSVPVSSECSPQPLAALEFGSAQKYQYCGTPLGPLYTCVEL